MTHSATILKNSLDYLAYFFLHTNKYLIHKVWRYGNYAFFESHVRGMCVFIRAINARGRSPIDVNQPEMKKTENKRVRQKVCEFPIDAITV